MQMQVEDMATGHTHVHSRYLDSVEAHIHVRSWNQEVAGAAHIFCQTKHPSEVASHHD